LEDVHVEEQAVQRVRALLAEAGDSHKDFEQNELMGVRDQDWPSWYARYLLAHGLNSLIGRAISEDELANLLQACDAAYRRDQSQEAWPDYYAQRIVEPTHGGQEPPLR